MTQRIDVEDEQDQPAAPTPRPAKAPRAAMPTAVRAALLLCMAGAFAMPAGPRAAHAALYLDGGVLLGIATDGVLLASAAILVATGVSMALRLIQSGLDPVWARTDARRRRNNQPS